MSALTKIFVVLLVVLSIVMAAGVVVWVNRQENYNASIRDLKAQKQVADAKATQADADRQLATTARDQLQIQFNNTLASKQQEIDQLRQAITDRDTRLAELDSNLVQATASSKSANDALVVAQKSLDQANTQLADLRKNDLQLQKTNADLSFALNDFTNKYEVTNHQWRDAEEQISQLKSDNDRLTKTLHQAGVSLNNPRVINAEPLIKLEGVVRSKTTAAGIPMATISLGSGDKVSPGMQFRVIDPNSKDPFLGYLIVDRTEPHEAIGHLTGPRINEIRPGVEVRTQL